jgi:hypothetical protein
MKPFQAELPLQPLVFVFSLRLSLEPSLHSESTESFQVERDADHSDRARPLVVSDVVGLRTGGYTDSWWSLGAV